MSRTFVRVVYYNINRERERWGLTSTRHKLVQFGTNIWFNFISIIRLRVGVFSSGRKPEDPEKTHEVGQATLLLVTYNRGIETTSVDSIDRHYAVICYGQVDLINR